MEALAKRQIGRLVSEMRRMKALVEDYQDRTNSSQNEIFRGNEKLDPMLFLNPSFSNNRTDF